MCNLFIPSVSFCCFLPALHVPLGGCVDMAGRWGRALCSVVLAPGTARQTVMDRRLQVLFFGPSDCTGTGLRWGAGSASSTATPASTLYMEGSAELRVQCHELCREPIDRGRELCNGGTITYRGHC